MNCVYIMKGCALLFVFIFLGHLCLCFAQNKLFDVLHDSIETIKNTPKNAYDLVYKANKGLHGLLYGTDRIFSQCFDVPNAFCVGGTTKVITAASLPEDLVGWWKFDEIYPIDHSGYGNHIHKSVRGGPAQFGHGASAAFSKSDYGIIQQNEAMKADNFTVAFWIYLLGKTANFYRNVFSKGNGINQTPTILLYPSSGRLSVRVSTNTLPQDGLSSVGTIPLRRWTHVTIIGSQNKLKIFLNGIKDNEITLSSKIISNDFGVTIGATLLRPGFEGYIDDLRYYRKDLKSSEISSLTASGLTGIVDKNFINIGCVDCDYDTAMSEALCIKNYKLCTMEELYKTGIHTARINGWLNGELDIWHSKVMPSDVEPSEKRTAFCCKIHSDAPIMSENKINEL